MKIPKEQHNKEEARPPLEKIKKLHTPTYQHNMPMAAILKLREIYWLGHRNKPSSEIWPDKKYTEFPTRNKRPTFIDLKNELQ